MLPCSWPTKLGHGMTRKHERRQRFPKEEYTVTIQRDAITGVAVSELWMKDGVNHRDDGPASSSRDPITRVVTNETWLRNNDLHREDGPACILRKPDGRVYYTEWFVHGEKIRPPRPGRTASTPLTGGPQNPAGPGA
jgi:hypothetical protein